MRVLVLACFYVLLSISLFAQNGLKSPSEFLGYELGERFTRHHKVVEYFQHVAAFNADFKVAQYGETYEGRPLIYGIISSPENIRNLEQIRTDNLRRTGMLEGQPKEKKAIVWLSYNVHGNESCSMEAVMWTLYDLANPANAKTKEWLKNTVVILDPCINPDGRDRYANFYNQYGNVIPNSNSDAKEHREPWPGGRPNHYLFDLNRDWAWLTQKESKQRIKIYNEWFPHVHVDFHEQGVNSPYYFAPAAEPYHEVVSPWQRDFQNQIGRNNAKYFDKEGWLYFTKEVFDLYYPSYGDTYPAYSGAIGMTYEQGGSGYAGLSIITEEGDPLTLKDRLTHHHTNGLSTIEISAQNANRLVDEFEKYFKENLTAPTAKYKSYVIKGDNNPDKLNRFTSWLDSHAIKYAKSGVAKPSRGYDFSNQQVGNVTIAAEDLVLNIYQPKGRFVTTVLEPETRLADSITYDLTAWNLIYSYGLKGYALTEKISGTQPWSLKPLVLKSLPEKPYAYIFNYKSLEDVKFMCALMNSGVRVRIPLQPFKIGDQSFDKGSIIVTRRNNEGITNLDEYIRAEAAAHNRPIYATTTGFVDSGKDFGSGGVRFVEAPAIATLIGDQTSSLNVGQIWHYFEQELGYPITQIGTEYFRNIDLNKYNVLIIPEGNYRLFDEGQLERVSSWVSDGGKLILIGDAIGSFVDKKGFGITTWTNDEEKSAYEASKKRLESEKRSMAFEKAERYSISDYITGAIYKVKLDKSHPLTFGLDEYYTLKASESRFGLLKNGWNVGTIQGKAKPVIGFAGSRVNKLLDNSLLFGVEDKGNGTIIYMADNPVFREFWENGKLLFANAVFIAGN